MNDLTLSKKNSQFWNEPCGSCTAKALGVNDSGLASLKKFDDWYWGFYPYLFDHIPFIELEGKDVLEIGLGYGTVSQHLAKNGCKYVGLDIASGSVLMVKQRLEQNALSGIALQGSILSPPFKPDSFDTIVAIGCLHHTGNLELAIKQCYDLLRPGGQLILMVYSAYSYRRWRTSPKVTFKYWLREFRDYRGVVGLSPEHDREAYDVNSTGETAPHTDWVSMRSLRAQCSCFSEFKGKYENIDQDIPFIFSTRKALLNTFWPKLMGLDLYATVIK